MLQNQIFRGSAPDPSGGAYNAPPDPLADGERARCPPPQEPHLTLVLWHLWP